MSHYTEMAKKTVIRRLFKYLPVSVEAQTFANLDEQAEAGVSQHNEDVIAGDFTTVDDIDVPHETATDAVKAKLQATVDTDTGEILDFDQIEASIEKADSLEALDACKAEIAQLDKRTNEYKALNDLINVRLQEMTGK